MSSLTKKYSETEPIRFTDKERRFVVLENIVKMLEARGWFPSEKVPEAIKRLTAVPLDHTDLVLPLTKTRKLRIKILAQNITTVSRNSALYEFLKTNKEDPKIIIITKFSARVQTHLRSEFPRTEIFTEEEMMLDIFNHVLVPKHELLTEAEKKEILDSYSKKIKKIPGIYEQDPIARRLHLRPGDICRIIRPSEITGESISYRYVRKGGDFRF
jgi:DNA-directed RNA polymerase subunit H (RpoH/RPB5)